jgi:hypothetical protein
MMVGLPIVDRTMQLMEIVGPLKKYSKAPGACDVSRSDPDVCMQDTHNNSGAPAGKGRALSMLTEVQQQLSACFRVSSIPAGTAVSGGLPHSFAVSALDPRTGAGDKDLLAPLRAYMFNVLLTVTMFLL